MRRVQCCSLALALAIALLAPLIAAAPALAQQWPTRNVRFILTLGPGSGTDIGGRLIADRLSKKWGQPVVIENKPGGDGIVAISAFVSAKDDHVLLLSPSSSFIELMLASSVGTEMPMMVLDIRAIGARSAG